MRQAIAQDVTIVYLDEVCFTTRSIMSRDYSNVGTNIEINPQHINIKTTAVIAAISEQHGMLMHECFEKSVNQDKFI